MIYGYARVSTIEQETALQLDALRRAGCLIVYSEKTSSIGKRPQLQELLEKLLPGDLLVVYKLDRLARSLTDLLRIIEVLHSKNAGLKSLTEPIDASNAAGRLMLQMLGAVAEFERNLIRERSIAGQRAAIERGVLLGRPSILSETKKRLVSARYLRGNLTMSEIAAAEGVSLSVVKRAVYKYAHAVR